MPMNSWIKKHQKGFGRVFWCLLLLFIWELWVKVSQVSPMLFPSVEDVLITLWEDLFYGNLLGQTFSSLWLICMGLLIALSLSLTAGLLSTHFKTVASFIDTLTAIAHPLPGLALLPLIIMWFGTGTNAVLAIIIHSALWPMLLNLMAGFLSVPDIYLDAGRNLSMGPIAITFEIQLRASMGYVLSGLKIGWARAWRALISAEMVFGAVGNKGGIGWYLLNQRTFMDTAGLFAGILLVIIIGILIEDVLFSALEKHTLARWGMNGGWK